MTTLPVKPSPVSTGAAVPIAGSSAAPVLTGSGSPATVTVPKFLMSPVDESSDEPLIVMATTAAAPTTMAMAAPIQNVALPDPDFFFWGAGLVLIGK